MLQKYRPAIMLLVLLMSAALGVRLLWAPAAGHTFDIDKYQKWCHTISFDGIQNAYAQRQDIDQPDNPPGFLWLLALDGFIYRNLISPAFVLDTPALRMLIKSNAIVADLLTGLLLFLWLRPRKGEWWALAGAAAWLFNPAVFFLSAYWGQTDSIYTFLAFSAVLLLLDRKTVPAWLLFTLAVFTKPQAMCLTFLILAGTLLRPLPMRTRAACLGAAALVAALMILPYLGTDLFTGPLRFVIDRGPPGYGGGTPLKSFSLWWPMTFLQYWRSSGQASQLALMSMREQWGWIGWLLAMGMLLAIAAMTRKHWKEHTVLLGAALSALAFFMTSPTVLERYLFPALPFLALLWPLRRGLLAPYLLLSFTFILNLAVSIRLPGFPLELPFIDGMIAVPINLGVMVYLLMRLRAAGTES